MLNCPLPQGGCCFCPPISSLTCHCPPCLTCFLLLLLFSPLPTLLTVLNITPSVFLSPTLLPLCFLVTPLLSLLHSHSAGHSRCLRLTSFSSLLVNTYPVSLLGSHPCQPSYSPDAGPLSPFFQLLEISLCPLFFHPPAALRANSISFYHPLQLPQPSWGPLRFSHCNFPLPHRLPFLSVTTSSDLPHPRIYRNCG